jgi:hypothetical protein
MDSYTSPYQKKEERDPDGKLGALKRKKNAKSKL